MATTRPFAYNPTPSTPITGTINVGNICIGVSALDYSSNPGGLTWWNGPDEDNSYVICKDVPDEDYPTPVGYVGGVHFWKCTKTDEDFRSLVQLISGTSQASAAAANTWLSSNGYWSNCSVGFDPDAQAFIDEAGIADPNQQRAINTLVLGLKADNFWESMLAIYPIVGATAKAHKYNLKDPRNLDAAFRLQFNGTWRHGPSGMLPNGTDTYANTFIMPFTHLKEQHNYSVYSTTNIDSGGFTLGSYELGGGICGENGFVGNLTLGLRDGNLLIVRDRTSGGYTQFANNNSLGHFAVNREGNALTVYKGGAEIGTGSSVQDLGDVTISLSALHVYDQDCVTDYYEGFDSRELAFVTFASSSKTNIDNGRLYTRIQAFQTALGRAV